MKILPYARKIIINAKKMCVEIIIIVLFLKIFNIQQVRINNRLQAYLLNIIN